MKTIDKEQFVKLIKKNVEDESKNVKILVSGLYSYIWEFCYPVCCITVSKDEKFISFTNVMSNEFVKQMTVNAMKNIIISEDYDEYDVVFSAFVKKGDSTKDSYVELFSIKPGQYDLEIKETDEEVIINVKTMYI